MPHLLIMQTGYPPEAVRRRHGDFAAMFRQIADYQGLEVAVADAAAGEDPGSPSAYAGVLVTGSEAMVTDAAPWSLAAGRWLAQAAARPGCKILAVCYGHQLLARSLGGQVDYHPQGPEIGCLDICLRPGAAHPFLAGLPPRFPANLFHAQSVLDPPLAAARLAASQHDPHQILAYGPDVLGVQFHPEFSGAIAGTYIEFCAPPLAGKEFKAADTPWPVRLLQNFLDAVKRERAG
jgi:GMP synthase (glutamine-hydrolysing)